MKKLLSIMTVLALTAMTAIGQSPAPGIFNYQGVARNSVGNVLVNKAITLRLTVHDGAAAGPTVYQESRATITNPFGLFNVQVGGPGATNVTGTIAGVNWGVNTKFIQVEIDPNGGTTFINIGTAQIASVPYSLYSSLSNDLVLPFNKTQADAGTLFRITNSGTGISGAIMGVTQSNAASAWGVHGRVDNTTAGGFSTGLLGTNLSTTGLGIGVTGSQNGSGWGVYGTTPSGIGVYGLSTSGFGVYGQSTSGVSVYGIQGSSGTNNAGRFQNLNPANSASTVSIITNGTSATALSVSGPDIWGSAIGITNTTSGMEWRMNVQGTTWQVTKIPGATFTPFRLQSSGVVDFPSTAGTQRVTILDNGNVGIGTAAPSTRLHVVGSATIQDGTQGVGRIFADNGAGVGTGSWQVPSAIGVVTGSGTLNYIPKWTPTGTNLGNSIMREVTTGVGFGAADGIIMGNVTNPNGRLTIKGADNSFDAGIRMEEDASTEFGNILYGQEGWIYHTRTAGNDHIFLTNTLGSIGNEAFIIKDNGNVGVRVTNPTSKFEVLQTGTTSAGLFTLNNAANVTASIRGLNTATNNGSWGILATSVTGTGYPGETNPAALVAQTDNSLGIVTSSLTNYAIRAGSFSSTAIYGEAYPGGAGAGVLGQGLGPNNFGVVGNAAPGTGSGGYFTGGTTALRTLGGVQLTGINEGVNRILTTVPGTGQATWEDAATVGIVSGSGTLNFIPKWTPNGTTLGNSMIFDDASNANLGGGAAGNRPSSLTIWQTPGTTDASLVFRTASGEFGGMFTGADGKLHLTTNSANPSLATIGLTVDDDGVQGVGIGTVNPATKLNVVQTDATAIRSDVSYGGALSTFSYRAANILSGANSNMGMASFNNTSSSLIPGWKAGVVGVDSSNDVFSSGVAGFYKGNTPAIGVYGRSSQNFDYSVSATVNTLGFTGGNFIGGDAGVAAMVSGTGTSVNKYAVWARNLGGGTNWAGYFEGQVAINDGTQGTGYVFTSDASGNGSWQGPVHMSAGSMASVSIPSGGASTDITTWGTLDEAGGANYTPGTGTYTIPVTGYYSISLHLSWGVAAPSSGASEVKGQIKRNGSVIAQGYSHQTTAGEFPDDPVVNVELTLTAGDTITFAASQNTSAAMSLQGGSTWGKFGIHLIHR